ncbi:MAG: glutathione S-transferase [Myxococcales bacterium]|jgi:glutathione S-transferase|nr:glutathione S-transferase [Myxococcales bacterium]
MGSSLILHVDPFWVSPYAFTAFVALKEKGVDFAVRTVDLSKGEHRKEPYRSASLTARIPALVHDGFWLTESNAIAEYIEDVFPAPAHRRLFPADSRQRARARQVMGFVRSDIGALREERSAETVVYKMKMAPLSSGAQRAASKLTELAGKLIADAKDTVFGEWSIADADLAFALHRLINNGDDVPPAVRAYAEAQWSRPSVRAYIDHVRQPFVPYAY